MANLLSSIPKIVQGATKSIMYDIVFTRTATTQDIDKPWLVTGSSPAVHACKGIVTDYKDFQFGNTAIQRGDRKIILVALTLPTGLVPLAGDRLFAQGAHYEVIEVTRDPASATFECQSRLI